ncbi:MAG: glycosyltransferase family 4 protein [Patescibacteria group bacterium]|jgi:glycosyltransferase involved in cell wall biosynthesis
MPDGKTKIAQVVCTFPPYRGGIGNVCYNISDHLSRLGYQVTVLTPRYSWMESDISSFFEIHKLNPQFKYGNGAIVMQLLWRVWKFDIVHFHYPFIGAALPLIIVKLLKGKKLKVILHYHMDLVGRGWHSYFFKFYSLIFLHQLIKRADAVIVNSEDYLKQSLVQQFYLKYPGKFKIMPNGVDINNFRPLPADQTLADKYGLGGKKVILFVGGLDSAHYFKGVNYLIKALEILNREDVKLIIVGDGDLRPIYEDLAESYGLSEKIIFTGYISDSALSGHYHLADIFVLPSIDQSEAFGMVLLEAMACAKPVVAANLPGVRKVVGINESGRLFKPKDVGQLVTQLKFFLDNPAQAIEYGARGRKRVEETYSWQIITRDLLDIYHNKS